jgi:hemerythrin-like domain-containing protein
MHTIAAFLGDDHRACDEIFAAAEAAAPQQQWDAAQSAFARFAAAMAHHFAMEEDVLFPAFEDKTGMRSGPTQVMRMEHEQMRTLMGDMNNALAARDAGRFLGLSETLNMLMQQHNIKEENMLYPMSDRVLGTAADATVKAMQALPQE